MSDDERRKEKELDLTSPELHTRSCFRKGAVTGRAADVIAAAKYSCRGCDEACEGLERRNSDVTEAIQKVAAAYDCKDRRGVDEAEFEENEVYSIDIVNQHGRRKRFWFELCSVVYWRPLLFRGIGGKAGPSWTGLNVFNHEPIAAISCSTHEKPGDLVAHIKFTVLLMPNGSDRITAPSTPGAERKKGEKAEEAAQTEPTGKDATKMDPSLSKNALLYCWS
nr:ERBB-3 BINDING PROTEIN 1 [Ipomoea batatas]